MNTGPDLEVTDEIINQLRKVRENGGANMMDIRSVQIVANKLRLYALVTWAQDVQGLPRSQMAKLWTDTLVKI